MLRSRVLAITSVLGVLYKTRNFQKKKSLDICRIIRLGKSNFYRIELPKITVVEYIFIQFLAQ